MQIIINIFAYPWSKRSEECVLNVSLCIQSKSKNGSTDQELLDSIIYNYIC